MQLLRISKGRAFLNALIAFGMAFGFNLFGASFIAGPCVVTGLVFLLVVGVKFYNDVKRAQVGLLYQHTPNYDEPEPPTRRSFGIYDPNDL